MHLVHEIQLTCTHLLSRTPGTGLYDNLQQYRIPDPTAIFDISFFVHNPKPFLTLARDLYPGRYQPNTVHYFVRLLQEKGLLLRNYTQNIDGLERCMSDWSHCNFYLALSLGSASARSRVLFALSWEWPEVNAVYMVLGGTVLVIMCMCNSKSVLGRVCNYIQ